MAETARTTQHLPAPRQRTAPRRDLLYPGPYGWYILVGSLDIMLTHTVIRYFAAEELNSIANVMLRRWGVAGLIALKFATVVVVVLICDYIGRRRPDAGRRLAEWAIALSAVPVIVSLFQIALISVGWLPVSGTEDVSDLANQPRVRRVQPAAPE